MPLRVSYKPTGSGGGGKGACLMLFPDSFSVIFGAIEASGDEMEEVRLPLELELEFVERAFCNAKLLLSF